MRWTAAPVIALLLLGACNDPVRPARVAELAITPEVTSLEVGDTLRLAAVARDELGATVEGARVAWSSDDPAVATVTDGLLRALAPGRVAVSAEAAGVVARAELTVEIPVHSIGFEPDRTMLGAGLAQPILVPWSDPAALAAAPFVMVLRNEAGQILPERVVHFTSRDTTVVRVTAAGELHAIGPGTTVVTARAGAATGELHVRVTGGYTLHNLGTLGGRDSRAYGINAAGQVVGESCTPERCFVPFLWSAGSMTALSQDLGAARAVSDDGTVVGTLQGSAVRWRDGVATVLSAGTAYAIGAGGTIVGGWIGPLCTRNCPTGGFIYRDGVVEQIPFYARGVSPDGEVVGYRYQDMANTIAVRYRAGQLVELSGNTAFDITPAGTVVGASSERGGSSAYLWERDGRRAELGVPRGSMTSRAHAINDRGQVVGTADPGGGSRRGFLWEDGFLADLNRLVATGGLVLEEAWDINGRGQIVGVARVAATGASVAFLLEPTGS